MLPGPSWRTRRRSTHVLALSMLLLASTMQGTAGFLCAPAARRLLATVATGVSASSSSAAPWQLSSRYVRACCRQASTRDHFHSLVISIIHRVRSRAFASSVGGGEGEGINPSSAPSSTSSSFSSSAETKEGNPTNKAKPVSGAGFVQKKPTTPAKKQPVKVPRGNNLLIVGLGNPGKEYTMTRHNAGFLVVDELARRLGADLKLRSAFQGEYGSANYKGKSIGLLKPTTFMNNSGQSVRKVRLRFDGS